MLEDITFNYLMQNGFAIAIAIYLLYERAKFNDKVSQALVRMSETLDHIEEKLNKWN